MSCDNELANEWARCSGKHASYITIVDVACCCSRLARFVQQCCAWACTIPNMSQQGGWARATCCAQQCCNRLAGACKCCANSVGICCAEMLRSFGRGFIKSSMHYPTKHVHIAKTHEYFYCVATLEARTDGMTPFMYAVSLNTTEEQS